MSKINKEINENRKSMNLAQADHRTCHLEGFHATQIVMSRTDQDT